MCFGAFVLANKVLYFVYLDNRPDQDKVLFNFFFPCTGNYPILHTESVNIICEFEDVNCWKVYFNQKHMSVLISYVEALN